MLVIISQALIYQKIEVLRFLHWVLLFLEQWYYDLEIDLKDFRMIGRHLEATILRINLFLTIIQEELR
jgi:hypothetical protein